MEQKTIQQLKLEQLILVVVVVEVVVMVHLLLLQVEQAVQE